ncbi:unnamed protein product [Cylicostephanus goldi]|uniref:Uncharacterized protein n=1 Tax=Cylicostephanus goldi TaxID=71465 RepID=A0A3P7Q5K2_CYLGO|nr:unnamed protein product [Cylicostephanus goldi]
MGYAYRSKESIEEKIRNETKKVQRFLRDEKDKFSGTGGGVYVLKKLAPYLHPLADALAEKHHVGGIPGIEDASGEEDVAITTDGAEQDAVSDEAADKQADALASTDPGPSQESQESSRPSQASAPTPSRTAREALSLFSDKRTQLYEEEIKVARMKQKKLQVEIQVAELKKEEAKFLVEAARARYNATNPTSPTSRPSTAEATSPTSKYMRYYNI